MALKDKSHRTQINGKFNYISSADKINKNITVELLFKNYKKIIHFFMNRRSEID
jgi:hypothetical protein